MAFPRPTVAFNPEHQIFSVKRHRLVLHGGDAEVLRISDDQLGELLAALKEGARLALRFQAEGISNQPGPRPRWLEACTTHVITCLRAGSAVLELEAPTLEQAAPDVFPSAGQISLLEQGEPPVPPNGTALDLFAAVLREIQQGDGSTLNADRALLEGCLRFARVPVGSFSGISLGPIDGEGPPVTLKASDIPFIEALVQQTPLPQALRFTAKLDTISSTRPSVTLLSDDGEKILARLPGSVSTEELRTLFGQRVMVAGIGHYRPSGRVQQIAISQIHLAAAEDELFSETPRAWGSTPLFAPVSQETGSGVANFFGTWPGEESDEDLTAALSAIR
ncbi:MAG: hypothetical protein ACK550_14845 [Synechococcaceae cyanobacterium]